jgi:hypothetical protein
MQADNLAASLSAYPAVGAPIKIHHVFEAKQRLSWNCLRLPLHLSFSFDKSAVHIWTWRDRAKALGRYSHQDAETQSSTP